MRNASLAMIFTGKAIIDNHEELQRQILNQAHPLVDFSIEIIQGQNLVKSNRMYRGVQSHNSPKDSFPPWRW